MRNFSFAMLALVLLLAGLSATFGITAARGDSPAVVINDQGCTMLDGNGLLTFTMDDHNVGTSSTNDNSMIWCKAKVTPSASGGTAHWDFSNTGLLCSTFFGLTSDWHETVSPSGEAKLVCIYPNGPGLP